MKQPKRFYTISEMTQFGFSRWELQCACHVRGQDFATKGGLSSRSVWRIDYEKYLKFREQATKKGATK